MIKRRLWPYILLALLGVGLFCIGGFVFHAEAQKNLSGICVGVGAAMFGVGTASTITIAAMRRYPEQLRQAEIEAGDERSRMIRDRAKSKGFDAMSIVYGAAMLITVLLDAELVITLLMVAAYLLVYGVQLYYLGKYSKEY